VGTFSGERSEEMAAPPIESDRSGKAKTPFTGSREANHVFNFSSFLYNGLKRLIQSYTIHIFPKIMEEILHRTNTIFPLPTLLVEV
jgi:hypothetical protein